MQSPEIEEVFSLAADPQLAENSRQGSERKNRAFVLGFEELKSQTMQWGSWQASGRTTSVPTVYLYDGPNLLEEVDSSENVLARYTQGKGIDEPLAELRSGTTSYYQADGLESVTSLTNSVGALANTYTYDSFGKLTGSTGTLTNPFQYTGREFDPETGIYEYRARYYDQSIGRFISEDTKGFDAGVNFYAYVKNNSPNFNDPSGKQSPAYSRTCIGKGGGWANPICGYCQYICYLDHPIWAGPIEIQPLSFLNVSIGTIQRACPSNGGKCPYDLFLHGGSPSSPVSRDWKITKCQQYRQ